MKQILGKCSCTQTYNCELHINSWAAQQKKVGENQTIQKMKLRGEKHVK